MMMPLAPGQPKVTRDQRYSNKYKYKYDERNRLIERLLIGNDGELKTRCVHDYARNQDEESCFSSGRLYFKSLSVLSEQGMVMERTYYRPKSAADAESSNLSVSEKNSYAYEFDTEGNWVKRTGAMWVTKDGRSSYQPSSVYYRTIAYY